MSGRILILTSSYGEGHNAAARALASAVDELAGPGTACVRDVIAEARPRLNAWSRKAYLRLINRFPSLWGAIYRGTDGSSWMPTAARGMGAERAHLAAVLREVSPRCLCSTYPVYSLLLDQLGKRSLKHSLVVTDSISVHSLWWAGAADRWFVPNEESADVLAAAKIPNERVLVSGFPVSLFFSSQAGRLAPPDLSLTSTRPRILHIINSGTAGAEETARRLLAHDEWDITCAIGRDEALKDRLQRVASGRSRPATLLGWTDRIPELLMTHHLVVSKAGGATTQEAIAAHCPMIVSQVVPGQEEGNYELLRRRNAGMLATTPASVEAAVVQALADGGALHARMRLALKALARPEAAQFIARQLLQERAS